VLRRAAYSSVEPQRRDPATAARAPARRAADPDDDYRISTRPMLLSRFTSRAALSRLVRTTVTAAAAALSVASTSACGGDDDGSTGPRDQVVGTYTLRTVGGRALPAVVLEDGGDKLEVLAGAVTLDGNGTYRGTMTLRLTEDGRTTTETDGGTGTYTASGSSVVLVDADGERTTATLAGASLTITDGGIVMVFTR
jgi:hypothetical protein